ncbi:MAG: caspase family protein [Verrucomicrobia bacterium]|nr:caspase family protein [Verrucomicrobiota bacterium]
MRLFLAFFTLCIVGGSLQARETAAARTALVIGNSRYEAEAGPLKNTVNDAKAVAATLRALGFQVIERQNVTRDQLIKAVIEFRATLAGKEVGLFYYAGHGLSIGGSNYLLPIKSGYSSQGADDVTLRMLAETRLFNVEQAVADMKAAGAGCNLVILDACRTTALANAGRTRDVSVSGGLAEMKPPAGSLIAFATDAGQTALDGEATNGLYTGELLKHLKTPGLTIEQVFKRTRAGVLEASDGKQIPAEYSRLVGDDIFLAGPASASEPAPAPAPVMVKAEPVIGPTFAEIKRLVSSNKAGEAIAAMKAKAEQDGASDAMAELFMELLDQVKDVLKKTDISPEQATSCLQTCDGVIQALPDCLSRTHSQFNELLAKAYNRQGDSLLGLARADEALVAFNKAIPLAPEDAYILYNRGRTHLILGDTESAEADFKAVSGPKFNQPKARQLAQEALEKIANSQLPIADPQFHNPNTN